MDLSMLDLCTTIKSTLFVHSRVVIASQLVKRGGGEMSSKFILSYVFVLSILYDFLGWLIIIFGGGNHISFYSMFGYQTKDGSSFQTLSSQTKHVDLFAERLSSIFVNIVDETDKPITNVLLSLSGSSSYRNNTRTGLEDEFQFSLLESGEVWFIFSFQISLKQIVLLFYVGQDCK